MRASRGGDIRSEKFKLLIENGANLDLQDKSGNTALPML